MRLIFLDTNYLAALFNAKDGRHAAAVLRSAELAADTSVRYVTLLANLTELLAYASGGGGDMRLKVSRFVDRVRSSLDTDVLDGDRVLFDDGLQLYRKRLDKTYSHADCMAMTVCKRLKIAEVLTADRDFEREGFTILI